ncbi:hypothetical protein BH24GEM1_BH24GEM1_13120 [soil metagenome]
MAPVGCHPKAGRTMDLESMNVETDLFEHREVKPHFINPCCFGDGREELRLRADLAADGSLFEGYHRACGRCTTTMRYRTVSVLQPMGKPGSDRRKHG